jgi:hypothetical protein
MELCKGAHMQIDAACLAKVFGKYAGTAPSTAFIPISVRHTWYSLWYKIIKVRASTLPTSAHVMMITMVSLATIAVTRVLLRKVKAGRIALQ